MNFNYPAAGLWRRLGAMIYDLLLVGALTMCYSFIVLGTYKGLGIVEFSEDFSSPLEGLPKYLFQLGLFLVIVGFYGWFWRSVGGQTLGMKAWRIQLVTEDMTTPSWPLCATRCVLATLSFAGIGIGYFWCWFDKHGHCLHDRLSKSYVIALPKKA